MQDPCNYRPTDRVSRSAEMPTRSGYGQCRKHSEGIQNDPFLTDFERRFTMRKLAFSNACAWLNRIRIRWMISTLTRCCMLESLNNPSQYNVTTDTTVAVLVPMCLELCPKKI